MTLKTVRSSVYGYRDALVYTTLKPFPFGGAEYSSIAHIIQTKYAFMTHMTLIFRLLNVYFRLVIISHLHEARLLFLNKKRFYLYITCQLMHIASESNGRSV